MTRDSSSSRRFLFLLLASVGLFGCGGDDGPANPGTGGPNSGVFLDSAVQGLEYSAGAQSGTTDAAGTFTYDGGANVTFGVGGITCGTGAGASVITPIQLVPGATNENHPTVTNIARFLQTIDDDANPDNGIVIVDAVRTAAVGLSVNFEQDVATFQSDPAVLAAVASLTAATQAGTRPLVDETAARDHLRGALAGARAGTYSGTFEELCQGDPCDQIGTWSLTVQTDGSVSGTAAIQGNNINFTGTVSSDGTLSGSQPLPNYYTLYGTIETDGSVSAMWYGPGEIGARMRGARN